MRESNQEILAGAALRREITDRAQTLTWNTDNLEEVLDKLHLTELERWVIGERLKALRLSITMLKEKAGVGEEDASS